MCLIFIVLGNHFFVGEIYRIMALIFVIWCWSLSNIQNFSVFLFSFRVLLPQRLVLHLLLCRERLWALCCEISSWFWSSDIIQRRLEEVRGRRRQQQRGIARFVVFDLGVSVCKGRGCGCHGNTLVR